MLAYFAKLLWQDAERKKLEARIEYVEGVVIRYAHALANVQKIAYDLRVTIESDRFAANEERLKQLGKE